MSSARQSDTQQFKGISYSTTLSAAVAAAVGATPAVAQQEPESVGIEEITVTATKRGEISIQDIAGSIQAFDTEAIRNQSLYNMEDYSKFTPSLAYFGNQVGQGKIFFRGIADAPDTFIVSQSAAVYIDEQPVTQSAAVDVRLVDIERVEALSGPQGTLYGSSSQSGTLRIVTNKPDPTKFEAFVDASLKGMSEGDNSYDFSGMVNLPLAEDRAALRLVGFTATEGGFIDNVLGITANCEWLGKCAPLNPLSGDGELDPVTNADAVKDDWNETTISGGRAGLKWFINDDWSATVAIAHQQVEADAENTYDPTVGDLELVAFHPDTFEDDWTQYALTIEGAFGDVNFTSATSYFERDSQYAQDTTSYAAYFGSFCYGPTVTYNIYCFQPAGQYYWYADPVGFLVNDQENTSFSQEFRLSFSGERVDWVAGVFWEDRHEEWDFTTVTTDNGGYSESAGLANWDTYWNVAPPSTDAWWFSGDDTDWETLAVFGEATFHFTDKFRLTAGARWFDVESDKIYFVELPGGRRTPSGRYLNGEATDKHGCLYSQAIEVPCTGFPIWTGEIDEDGSPINEGGFDSDNPDDDGFNRINSSDDDTAVKVSLQYDVDDDRMIYALYSEGFRAGGVNRNRGAPRLDPTYGADFLKNYEFGLKSQWAGGRLQVNAVVFLQDWEDYQVEVVDPSNVPCNVDPTPPCGQPWQKGVLNAGNASSDGVELQIDALPTERLSLRFNATFLDSKINSEIEGLDDVGKGSELPFAPEFKGSAYAQYSWPAQLLGSNEAFVQFQYSHVGDSLNQVQATPVGNAVDGFSNAPQLTQESYDVSSLKFGLISDTWEANIFVNNLGDERGQLYHDITDFETFFGRSRVSVIRPREYGVRFFRRWE